MPRNVTVDELKEKLSYDPETGSIVWKVRPNKNVFVGNEAGCVKTLRTNKNGEKVAYKYIRLGAELPAQRVAWALYHGQWPSARITFVDKNPLNLRIDNLQESYSPSQGYSPVEQEMRKKYLREHRDVHPHVWKDIDLQRRFGISLDEYIKMAIAQHNKCAICGDEEKEVRNGTPKNLAVDHDHATGKVRGLLCTACNQGIGKFKDDPQILKNAISYLERYSTPANNVLE